MKASDLVLGLVFLVGLVSAGGAASLDELYQAQTIVTGQGEANRLTGFGPCLEDVLVKVSGDPRLIGDARIQPIERRAADFVAGFSYHDRMSGIPTHDEQGSRERPYDLTVHFDQAKIDAALRALGSAPWTAERPRLAVFIAMHQTAAAYLLASDSSRGLGERQALAAAATKRGMPIVLPSTATLDELGITSDHLPADTAQLDAAARKLGADVALGGRLDWSERELGWAAAWSLLTQNGLHQWQVRGVSFDEAFRNAMGGAAQILSGHGDPAFSREQSK